MPKVSIIIPVYNVEKYLRQALDSVVNQTLKDIEIICIDDCSTDGSYEILQEYASKDDRFVVLKQEINQGQGVARNRGLDIAKGEYIGFIDPDDWIELDMYEKMYNQAKNLFSEIVICDYQRYIEAEKIYLDRHFFKSAISIKKAKNLYINAYENIDKDLINNTLLVSPCYCVNRLYSKNLLNKYNIKFLNIRCCEDVLFILNSHICAKYISYINSPFYKYRIHKNSTLYKSDEKYIPILQTFYDINQFFTSKNLYSKFKLNIDYFIINNTIWTYNHLTNKTNKKIFLKNVKLFINKNDYKLLKSELNKSPSFLQQVFSITNSSDKKHKIITIFGIKIALKRRKKETSYGK